MLKTKIEDDLQKENMSVDQKWRCIEKIVKTAALEIIRKMFRARNLDWFGNNCKNIIQEKNKAKQMMIQTDTRSSRKRCKEFRKQANKIIRKKEKQAINKEIEKIKRMNRKHEKT